MKLSLVIPTRERAGYLAVALRSALTAADKAGCAVEVVVSDNASTDDTAAVVQGCTDPRLVTLHSERRLSMRENFEFALSGTTGSHIVFIGDDDAVLPNGLRILSRLIAADDPDIVKWRVLNYLWPDPALGTQGSLKVRPPLLDGRLQRIDPSAVLDRFARADFRTYHEGGMIYHGCVSRRLIDAVIASGRGPYFRGSSPDVFTSLQALMISDRPMLRINLPLTLGGASPRSNGAAGQTSATAGLTVEGTEFARFITESDADPWQCRLPARCQSLTMVTLDCLQSAAELHGVALDIDRDSWARLIRQDVARFGEPGRGECLALARDVLGLVIALPPQALVPEAPNAGSPHRVRETVATLRHGLSKLFYSGGAAMENAAAAAHLLDSLLSLNEHRAPASGPLVALRNIVRQHLVARHLIL